MRVVWKSFLIVGISVLLQGKSCKKEPPPSWDGELWIGDSETGSIVYRQDEEISCRDPEFDDYVCMTIDDYIKIVNMVDTCKEWYSYATKKKTLKKIRRCGIIEGKN